MENNKIKLPIGTPVFDARYGWGVVEKYDNCDKIYTIVVFFKNGETESTYTEKGFYDATHKAPSLSLTEYDYVNGGLTPISDFNKPKIGDWGFFWDDSKTAGAYYCKLIEIKEGCNYIYIHQENGAFENFSKTVPEHLK